MTGRALPDLQIAIVSTVLQAQPSQTSQRGGFGAQHPWPEGDGGKMLRHGQVFFGRGEASFRPAEQGEVQRAMGGGGVLGQCTGLAKAQHPPRTGRGRLLQAR